MTACVRGSLALFGVLLVTRIAGAALAGIAKLEGELPQEVEGDSPSEQ